MHNNIPKTIGEMYTKVSKNKFFLDICIFSIAFTGSRKEINGR